ECVHTSLRYLRKACVWHEYTHTDTQTQTHTHTPSCSEASQIQQVLLFHEVHQFLQDIRGHWREGREIEVCVYACVRVCVCVCVCVCVFVCVLCSVSVKENAMC